MLRIIPLLLLAACASHPVGGPSTPASLRDARAMLRDDRASDFARDTASGEQADEADIRDPGPDYGYIPNCPQVVPPGRVYVESALQSTQGAGRSERTTYVPILVRVGVAEDLELRAAMNVVSHFEDPTTDSTGHGPLQLGFKYRFNRGGEGFMEPSWGTELEVLLPVASADMDSGKVEGTLTVNVDHFVTKSTTLTWNAGAAAPVDSVGDQYAQAYVAAAVNQWVAEPLQLYVTGEWRSPASGSGDDSIARAGLGFYWYFAQRVVLVGGYIWGLTDESLDTDAVLGCTFAF